MKTTTKRQMTKLLREIQRLQADYFYKGLFFSISLIPCDKTSHDIRSIYVSIHKKEETASCYSIYNFSSYEDNLQKIKTIKDKINTIINAEQLQTSN